MEWKCNSLYYHHRSRIGTMKVKPLLFFLFLLLLNPGELVLAEDDFSPTETIEHIIAKARAHARENNIDLRGKFISKIEYHNNMQNRSEQPYWQLLWINKKVTKGGGVELRLYPDRAIKVYYHK